MTDFNRLVSEQMKTMDHLLNLQSKLERCQEIEQELKRQHEETKLVEAQSEISRLKNELKEVHNVFEQQTEEVIRSYQIMNVTC
jgi:biotin-(acetyl-CoA carboxylase) ligase